MSLEIDGERRTTGNRQRDVGRTGSMPKLAIERRIKCQCLLWPKQPNRKGKDVVGVASARS
jgi:hypothetical protein